MTSMNIAYTVASVGLLPPDAILQASDQYGPTYLLSCGAYVVVTTTSATAFPQLTHISPYDKYVGEDVNGNPVYAVYTAVPQAGGASTGLLAMPTLDSKSWAPGVTTAPPGYVAAGSDPGIVDRNGIPVTIYQSITKPSLFTIPSLTAIPAGGAEPAYGYNSAITITPLNPGQTSIATGQTIWLGPVDPESQQSLVTFGGMDFNDVFSPHSSWTNIGADVRVVMLNSEFILNATDQQLKNFFADLRTNNLQFAVETGVVSVLQPGNGGVESFVGINTLHTLAQRIQSVGGFVDYLVMDEPLYYGQQQNNPMSATIRSAVDNIQQFTDLFPNVQVGEAEPATLLNAPAGYNATLYNAFQTEWTAADGRPLSFFQADVNYGAPNWQADLASFEASANQQGEVTSVIFDGNQNTSSAAWTSSALTNATAVGDNKLLRPVDAVFQSWMSQPTLIGEPNDSASLAGLVNEYLAEPLGGAPAAVVASPTEPYLATSTTRTGGDTSVTVFNPVTHAIETVVTTNSSSGLKSTKTFDASGLYDEITRNQTNTVITATSNDPFFDPKYYVATYATQMSTDNQTDPLTDYEEYGAAAGRNPSSIFNTVSYNALLKVPSLNPLSTFEDGDWRNLHSPTPLFDPEFYLNSHPGIRLAGVDPILNYMQSGTTLDPSPLFMVGYYNSQEGAGTTSADVLVDYQTSGWRLGLNPSSLFNTNYYLSQHGAEVAASGMDPLSEYLSEGWKLGNSPTPWFDPSYYLAHNPDVAALGVNPLVEYLEVGWKEGRDPSAAFSTNGYLAQYPGLAALGINPLVQYLQYLNGTPVAATSHVTDKGNSLDVSGTVAGQSTHDDTPIQPFASIYFQSDVTEVRGIAMVTLTNSAGSATDSNGTFSGVGITRVGVGVYDVTGTMGELSHTLDDGVFTPAVSGTTVSQTTTFTVVVRDGGTNDGGFVSDSATTVTVDPTCAAAPTIMAVTTSITGVTGRAVVTGFSDAGSTVVLSDQAGLYSVTVGSTTARADGSWSITADHLSFGTHDFTAAATSVAGNLSSASAGSVSTIDPLFDRAWYLAQNPDVAASDVDPYTQYMTIGWTEGRDPDPYFDTKYYLKANPDVAAAEVNPLLHYEQYGWKEGRDPSLAFSTEQYLTAHLDVAATSVDPLEQFLTQGQTQGYDPVPVAAAPAADTWGLMGSTHLADFCSLVNPGYVEAEVATIVPATFDAASYYQDTGWKLGVNPDQFFDSNFYLTQNPDVKAAGVDPLLHYEMFGWKEGRDPSLTFSDQAYLSTYQDVAAANVDPLLHFVLFGQTEGRSSFAIQSAGIGADPLVNSQYYAHQIGATLVNAGVLGEQELASNFDTSGWQKGLNPDALFDTNYYLSHNPDVAAAHVNPLLHYEEYGWKEGRDPSAGFSTDKYLQAYSDVKSAGVDPLLHYAEFGQEEGRAIFIV